MDVRQDYEPNWKSERTNEKKNNISELYEWDASRYMLEMKDRLILLLLGIESEERGYTANIHEKIEQKNTWYIRKHKWWSTGSGTSSGSSSSNISILTKYCGNARTLSRVYCIYIFSMCIYVTRHDRTKMYKKKIHKDVYNERTSYHI